jgi:ABC-type molybdate transport system substrate-binding protein
MDFAPANPLKRRIEAGETFDLLIASVVIDELTKQGKVAADTRVRFRPHGIPLFHTP